MERFSQNIEQLILSFKFSGVVQSTHILTHTHTVPLLEFFSIYFKFLACISLASILYSFDGKIKTDVLFL